MSKAKEAGAPAKVLKYLLDTNRPYSAIDITNNLHKEFGKTCIQHTLDQLVSQGKLREKVYGKQKVYVADQSQFPEVAESELKAMDNRITQLQEKMKETKTECQSLESTLIALKKSLTTEEARSQSQAVDTECQEMEARLNKIKSGNDSVSPEESARINKEYQDSIKLWRKRKRMTNDIVNTILEGYPKSKKQLLDEVGIETDEDHSVSIPS